MNNREAIEYFHLSFSNRLAAKVDRHLFCLKGGCNLRFYFESIRYSEDIDFDIHTTSVETLKKHVNGILNDKTFKSILKHQDIEIAEWSAPKQTKTTQRWKVSIKLGNQSLIIPTKIEFSRRKQKFDLSEIKPVSSGVINQYKLQTILLHHYTVESAIQQKIGALINRTETQARDVIDLQILKNKLPSPKSFPFPRGEKKKAIEMLMSISFDHYKSQVWPYLLTELLEGYKSKETWNQIQEDVCNFIEDHMVEE
jgi:predicted nucleotidyltransferase component of viral defense system